MKNIIIITFLLSSLFAQYEIEDRWHLVGYEDNIMYQFENNYRYSIYSTDGNFGGLEDAGNSPNPYTVEEDIITIDLFFGNIVNYQMNYRCDGQVVDFIYIPDEIINVLDVIILVNHILSPASVELDGADINYDGDVNVLDVIQLIIIILDLEPLPEVCFIVPEVGPCDGICPTYYYNQNTNQCEEFITGCCGVEAFNTMQDCQNSCE